MWRSSLICAIALAACTRSKPLPKTWKLSLSFSSGMCEETEKYACGTSWEVRETGPILRTDHFRAGGKTREFPLSADERSSLEAALRSPRFRAGLESKEPCPGEVHDLFEHLSFEDTSDTSKPEIRHNITACQGDHFAADVVRKLARQ